MRVAAALLLLGIGLPASGPVASPGRFFLCFFETDSAVLLDRCQGILDEYASAWRYRATHGSFDLESRETTPSYKARIEVWAHADGEEASRDAAALSRARGEAVIAALKDRGLDPALITLHVFGASRHLVPTDDAEVQNRRVEIIMRQPPASPP